MLNPMRPLRLLRKGIKNPQRVPPYVLKRVYPSRYSSKKVEQGIVTWNTTAGFGWGDGDTPPQIAAINYQMVRALRQDLEGQDYQHAVEIGCGYGRVTPWLTEFATNVTGIEPNDDVLTLVDRYYQEVNMILALAQDLPLSDDSADLLFTRAVLQHIGPGDIEIVTGEIERIAMEDAHLLICEATEGSKGGTFFPRSVTEYSELFDGFSLESSWRRNAPAKTRDHNRSRMFFIRGD